MMSKTVVSSGTKSSPARDQTKPRLIVDHVHGPVELRPVEWDLINTKAFQRLRRIKQLGLVELVFPGAEHSRFTHSIGTLAMMSRLISQLLINNSDDKRFCEELRTMEPTLRVAALLHDIGHFPLSHLFERMYQYRHMETLGLNEEDIALRTSPPSRDYLQEAAWVLSLEPGDDYNHEVISAQVVTDRPEISHVIENHGLVPREVAALIRGERPSGNNYVFRNLMHSELDADRLDYLQRDCIETGMVYGRVDAPYIASLLRVAKAEEPGDHQVFAFARKGLKAADHYSLARFHFYSQIIHHKTVCAFNVLAGALILHMMDHEMLRPLDSYEKVRAGIRKPEFLFFTDHVFWNNVRRLLRRPGPEAVWAHCLYHRLPPRLLHWPPETLQPVRTSNVRRMDQRLKALREGCIESGSPTERAFVVETEIGLSRPVGKVFDENVELVRVLDRDGKYACCLVNQPDSLANKILLQTWHRTMVFGLNPAVPEPSAVDLVAPGGNSN